MAIHRNVARTVAFGSITTAGAANTATTPTVLVDRDGAGQVAATNAPVHQGNGSWKVALTASEMDADLVVLTAVGSGLVPSYRELYTEADYTAARAAKVDHLDAAITSRMATYTQPSGFLAATFPAGTLASTTNIAAGTITTVTNLTNAPTSGDFTAAMKASLDASAPSVAFPADYARNNVAPTWMPALVDVGGVQRLPVHVASSAAGDAVATIAGAVGALEVSAGTTILQSLATIQADAGGSFPADYARDDVRPAWMPATVDVNGTQRLPVHVVSSAAGDAVATFAGAVGALEVSAGVTWLESLAAIQADSGGSGAGLTPHALAYLYGDVTEDTAGNWTYHDPGTSTPRLRFLRRAAPGGRVAELL